MLVTVIADASYDHPTRAGGFGYWAVSQRGRHSGGGPFKSLSRNSGIAEMMAVINGVHMAFVHQIAFPGDVILAQTDCMSAIQAFEGKRLLQEDERILADGLKTLLQVKNATVRFKHVKGHTNGAEPRLWVNNHCDAQAKQGMQEARALARKRPLPELIEKSPKAKRPRVGPKKIARTPEQHAEHMVKHRQKLEAEQRFTRAFAFDQEEWNRYVMDPQLRAIPPWEEQELSEQPVARDGVGLSHAA